MGDRILLASFFMIFIIWGVLCLKFPEFMFRTNGTNTLKKKPTAEQLKRVGITLIIIALFGGFTET